jgi:Ca2+-transporting ATPase
MSQIDHVVSPGLSSAEVIAARQQYGENRLPQEKGTPLWILLLNQVKSPLIYIILVAALVSLVARELIDFAIIMAVVVIDVILGFVQEYQVQKTYVALKGLLQPTTTVLRDGERCEIEVWELVPGDVVLLNSGEQVPGDGQLLDSIKLSLDEAILTGESEPVVKTDGDSLFMGTTVMTGRGTLLIQKTGIQTALGQITASLQEHVEEDTPLQTRLKAFSKTLTKIVVGFTLTILITGLIMDRGFLDMLRTAIILAIAAVPEGLLIAVTVILVLGMRKILKRNGLVKRLLAVESLGSVTVICTDKTGTLTEGRMRVSKTEINQPERALQTMVLCNDLEGPVDIAMWEYARQQMNFDPQQWVDGSQRVEEEIFTSERKFMITAISGDLFQDRGFNFLKGAPEIVMEMCQMPADEKRRLITQIDQWAAEGLRMIGLAFRSMGALSDHSGYTWVGLVGMEDPIRPEVIEAVHMAQGAGIQVKMITGDYLKTAEHIARSIGIMHEGDISLEGSDIARFTDQELQEQVRKTAVFARIFPQDKFRIVKALQSNGEITAMIGDGVNDAPALQQANIGVVVGSATDVAKETADLILLDNNFRTIVSAIEEGRVIFNNIRKVVAYTLSNSFAEVLAIFIAMILRWPTPLLVAQILWIHLICDGPSDIVLGFEPKENGIMNEKPRPLNEPILNRLGLSLIGIISISSAIFVLMLFNHQYAVHGNAIEGRSIAFASFAINSMVYIFAYRSMRLPLFRMNKLSDKMPLVWAVLAGLLTSVLPFLIPGLGSILGVVPLTFTQWLVVVGIALWLLMIVELGKWVSNKIHANDWSHIEVQKAR